MVAAISSILSIIPGLIGLGLSSFGAYSLATETGYMANIPAVEQFIQSLPF